MTTAKEIDAITAIAADFAHDLAGQAAEEIARQEMGLRTLETQNSDSADFKELAVWTIRKALEAAYDAGVETALQAAAQHVENMAAAAEATAKRQIEEERANAEERIAEAEAEEARAKAPKPEAWLVMEDTGRGAGWREAHDTQAEAMEAAQERAEENEKNGATDTVVWVQPATGFFPTL